MTSWPGAVVVEACSSVVGCVHGGLAEAASGAGSEPENQAKKRGAERGELDLTVKPDRGFAVAEVAPSSPSPLLPLLPMGLVRQ